MQAPSELSARFVEAYNQRNREGMRTMLSPTLEYVRPGGEVLSTSDQVMAQYERDWSMFTDPRVEIRSFVESGEDFFGEITIPATVGDHPVRVEGAVAHTWRDGMLARYRAYLDPLPQAQRAGEAPSRES
jgi:hypothetical protein